MPLADQDGETQVSEGGGLRVTYNESNSSFTLEWNPETHPEYNYLNDFLKDEVSEYLIGVLKEQLFKEENSLTPDNNMTYQEDVAAYAASMGWKEVEPDKVAPTVEELLGRNTISQQADRESPKKRALRGAVCDYIDEMEVDALTEDLISILTKEETYFRDRANIYASLKESVKQWSEKFKNV